VDERGLVRGLCAGRLAIGAALVVAPGRSAQVWTGAPADAPLRLAARSVGGRDVALALGTLVALHSDAPLAAWLKAGATADASDAVGTLATFRSLPAARRWLFLASALGAAGLGLRLASWAG
jgi:hypothetical protein